MADPSALSLRGFRHALREQLGDEALTFGLLRSLTMIGGMVALFLVPLRPEHRIHLAPLLGGFIFLRPVADHQGVDLVLALDPDLPALPFDRTMLKHAVQNMIRNSLETLETGGRLTVSTACDGKAAMVCVADDGPGIPPDAADRLFEPFFATKPRSTGLGLSIVRQVAREHGGDVTWTSRPGAGARFTIRLPLEAVRHG